MISVRRLQRSEGEVSDVYLFLITITRQVDLAISLCPSVRPFRPFLGKLVSQFLSYRDKTFPKVFFFCR